MLMSAIIEITAPGEQIASEPAFAEGFKARSRSWSSVIPTLDAQVDVKKTYFTRLRTA